MAIPVSSIKITNGTVNILMGGAVVRTLSYQQLREIYPELPEFDKNVPIATHGPDSVIPECRKLAN